MFDPNKFCHIASNARNRTKLACFLYKGKGAEWHQPGFFNSKATELNVDDFIFCYDENQTNVKRALIEICRVTEKTTDTITVRSVEFAPATLLKVFHDESLLGDGTEDSPLKINPDAIVSEVIHDDTLLGNGTTEAPLGVNNALYTTDTDFVTPITTTNKGVTQEDIKGFITSIVHDDTLTGDGTTESPLGVNPAVGNVTLDTAQTITGKKTFAEQTIFTHSKATGAISFPFQYSTAKNVAFAAGYAPLSSKAFSLSMIMPTGNTLQYRLGSSWGGCLIWTESGISVTATSADRASRLGHGQLIDSQMPSAANNYTWFRKYSDGYVEQGGLALSSTVTYPVPLSSWSYPEYNSIYNNTSPAPYFDIGQITSQSGTGFNKGGNTQNFVWRIVGVAAN